MTSEIIFLSTKPRKRRRELRTELAGKRDGIGNNVKFMKQLSFVY